MKKYFIQTIILLNLFSPFTHAEEISILSLNLHGYHPSGESKRFFGSKAAKYVTSSDIFYFSPEELKRGHTRRITNLAKALNDIQPDIVLFQEVGAGDWNNYNKNCDDFYRKYKQDSYFENSVIRLQRRMPHYQYALGCRGNLGWITDKNTFASRSIVDKDGDIIFRSGDNPYPAGILIEGMGVLLKKTFDIVNNFGVHIPCNFRNEKIYVQFTSLKKTTSDKWYLIANIHH